MRKLLLFALVAGLAVLALAPVASSHQVTPPGQGAPACTTNVHAGDATNPAHGGRHDDGGRALGRDLVRRLSLVAQDSAVAASAAPALAAHG
jgi:hypothetical protein